MPNQGSRPGSYLRRNLHETASVTTGLAQKWGQVHFSSLWQLLKQVVGPSSPTVLAALLLYPDCFKGLRIGLVLTGGNVDLDALPWFASLSAVESSSAR